MSTELTKANLTIHEHRLATRKMRWWYEHLADFMIAHPTARQNEIALHFNRSPGTISTIVNSDAFKAYLSKRRREYESSLDSEVRGKLLNVANRGLDFLLEGLEKKRDSLPIETLQKTVDTSLKSLGYGQEKSPSVVVNNNPSTNTVSVAVSLDDLQAAQQALRASQNISAPPVIEGEVTEVVSDDDLD